jgi:hypothetical protein
VDGHLLKGKLSHDKIASPTSETSNSSYPDGDRKLWKLIWNTNVPPKIRVFGWKLATNSLGVQRHRHRRNMDVLPTCSVCGMEPESAHHAMIVCTKAVALRKKLKEVWELPMKTCFGIQDRIGS